MCFKNSNLFYCNLFQITTLSLCFFHSFRHLNCATFLLFAFFCTFLFRLLKQKKKHKFQLLNLKLKTKTLQTLSNVLVSIKVRDWNWRKFSHTLRQWNYFVICKPTLEEGEEKQSVAQHFRIRSKVLLRTYRISPNFLDFFLWF